MSGSSCCPSCGHSIVDEKKADVTKSVSTKQIFKENEEVDTTSKPHYTFDAQNEPLRYRQTTDEAKQSLSAWIATGDGNGPSISTEERVKEMRKQHAESEDLTKTTD